MLSGDTVVYAPDAGFSGIDSFAFKISDGVETSDSATVTVNVTEAGPRTITVNTTGDTNSCGTPCSLRGAILVANSGDTIVIPAGTYTLTSLFELTINKSLTLAGAGSGDTIIQAAAVTGLADFRVFHITKVAVAISGVTIRNGKPTGDGGGILNEGTLTLTDSSISGNSSSGLWNSGGTVTVAISTVSGNSESGVWNSSGTVMVTSSTISGNSAVNGGGIYNEGGTLTVASSTISGNSASAGGGIYNKGTLILASSTVSGNSYNGIWNIGGTLTVTSSNVSGNSGSGIFNNGTLTVASSTISGNSDRGIENYFGNLTLTSSTISGNSNTNIGGGGGGISNVGGGTLTLTSSTVSGNSATDIGGGIYNESGTLTLTSSTVSGNSATNIGGGVFNGDGATVRLTNTILAVNTSSLRPDCRGSLTSLGHNLIGDSTGCGLTPVTGDLANVDPKLGPLTENGGPTLTHALLPGSPAIDSGDDASCPATDQRGIARPQGAHCDIGAFEFTGTIPPRAFDQTLSTTGVRPVTILLTASDPDTGDTLSFIIVSPPAGGDLFEGATITGDKITTGDRVLTGDTVTYRARLGFAGTTSFTFKANDGTADGNVATVTIVVDRPTVKGTVRLESMPNPISGARVTLSTGGQTVARVTSDPGTGSFEIRLASGIYDVKVEKDGFLAAQRRGVVVDGNIMLPEVRLLWGERQRGRPD